MLGRAAVKSLKIARPRRALYPAFSSYPTRQYSSQNRNSNQRFEYSPPKQQATSSRHGPNAQRPSDFLTNATESSAVRGSTSTSAVGGIQEELQALDAQIKQLEAQQGASKQEFLSRIPRYPSSENDSQTSAPLDGTTTPQSSSPSAIDSADAHAQDQAPTKPLPDLMQGIPSTIDAELAASSQHGQSQPQDLNITEDPDAAGQGGRESHIKTEYISSIDRRRANYLRILYGFVVLNLLGSAVYYGRNWEDEEEERKHPNAPSGWGLRLFYNRMRARWQDTMDYYNEPAFPKLLPNMDATMKQPYTLILSLDDLLVHSEWTREHGWRMAKRPGVDYFLRYLCQYYELVIWTSSPSMYAQPIVAKLDPYRIVMWPLFREATRYQKGEYIKDLDYLNRNAKKVIMVDTVASHAKHQPENAIIIPKWKGNLDDKGLVSLIPFLEYCGAMNFDDLRTVLKSFEGKDIPTEFARRESIARSKLQKQLGEEQGKKPKRSKGMFSSFTGGAPKMIGPDGTEMPSYADSADEAKTYADFIRERGQKQYELLEREIRANGESWLKEMAEEEKKANDEAMQGLKTSAVSYIPFWGGKSSANQDTGGSPKPGT